jgi:hypothetical protein
MMETVELKDRPDIARLVKAISKKRKAFLRRQDAVVLDGTYWDGGSRSDYYLVHIASGQIKELPHSAPPQFGGVTAAKTVAIEPGYAVVEAGTFCGKPATPTVFLRHDQQ